MPEMTPERLRLIAAEMASDDINGWPNAIVDAASAWEADLARIEALKRDLRQTCWHTAEGNDYLYCGLCEGEVRDGADQATLDAAHDPGCSAALAAEPKLVDLGGGLSSYENLGRNPPEERAALAAGRRP